jgi:hypothetical protein
MAHGGAPERGRTDELAHGLNVRTKQGLLELELGSLEKEGVDIAFLWPSHSTRATDTKFIAPERHT